MPRAVSIELRGRVLVLVGHDGVETVPGVDEAYRLLVEALPAAGSHAVIRPPELVASRYPLVPGLVLDLNENGTPVVQLVGRSRGRTESLTTEDLRRGHVVVAGTWFPIEAASSHEVLGLLERAGAEPGPVCSLPAFLGIRKAGGPVEDMIGDRAVSPLAFLPPENDAPNVSATLYPYQLTGWRWLRFIRSEGLGGLLADEMGLGKTLQVISVISDLVPDVSGPCLIVAPGSLLENWRREIARFAPDLRVLKHHGPRRTGRPADMREFDVVVTSYDNVVRDNSLLSMIRWEMVVLDEAQFIRNPDAQRTKAVKHLPRRVGLAVTGTPIENRLLDLWSIVDFVLPGQLDERREFESRYPEDVLGARLLEASVSPFMLRRRVKEVAQDLPPRIDIPQVVELSDEEALEYDYVRKQIAEEYGAAATLVSLTQLRRFCAHPSLLDDLPCSAMLSFSKFQRLDEILREIFIQGEKALVFTSFTRMADMVAMHVSKTVGCYSAVIDGRLPIDDRQPLIDTFSGVAGPAVLVLNPRAGGAGLNITAANHVIHYNPEWNPALEDQASARAHRRGQELPVTVHRLLVADTVEDVINERLERKRAIASSAIVGVAGSDDDYADIISALSRSPSRKGKSG
ncbi:DEAD/DEAH box helicase [Arenimonas caeni]|uniref:ATP-dependent helicase n=1 Tax=Arenimonas caeni TaxID=2058085 RepID=A0A2P6M8E3_9GAMM|nr:DEAD/DEAH box helicase [Arenimonas caeni]PRH82241.1 ATP-dependent helicase [Arenimonas caeni]